MITEQGMITTKINAKYLNGTNPKPSHRIWMYCGFLQPKEHLASLCCTPVLLLTFYGPHFLQHRSIGCIHISVLMLV